MENNQSNNIAQLTNEWMNAKREESQANQKRIAVELKMLELLGTPNECSKTHDVGNGLKLTITGKMNYSANMDALIEICEKLPKNMRPLKTETKLDETGAKYLRNNEPETWAIIAPAITVKPAKPSITVKA